MVKLNKAETLFNWIFTDQNENFLLNYYIPNQFEFLIQNESFCKIIISILDYVCENMQNVSSQNNLQKLFSILTHCYSNFRYQYEN
jgi:hypothetical protein